MLVGFLRFWESSSAVERPARNSAGSRWFKSSLSHRRRAVLGFVLAAAVTCTPSSVGSDGRYERPKPNRTSAGPKDPGGCRFESCWARLQEVRRTDTLASADRGRGSPPHQPQVLYNVLAVQEAQHEDGRPCAACQRSYVWELDEGEKERERQLRLPARQAYPCRTDSSSWRSVLQVWLQALPGRAGISPQRPVDEVVQHFVDECASLHTGSRAHRSGEVRAGLRQLSSRNRSGPDYLKSLEVAGSSPAGCATGLKKSGQPLFRESLCASRPYCSIRRRTSSSISTVRLRRSSTMASANRFVAKRILICRGITVSFSPLLSPKGP